MGIGELLLLAVGVSMDAFAVSVCKGLAMKKVTLKAEMTCGLWFGGFQALMPTIGFFLGTLFADAIEAIDHWVAFVLLAIIGFNMLKEAFDKEDGCECGCGCDGNADMSVKTMFVMAVATSIDALSVGFTISEYDIIGAMTCAAIIASITWIICAIGLVAGKELGSRFTDRATIFGGAILILIGLKIFIEGVVL